jgi:hypothetical protein
MTVKKFGLKTLRREEWRIQLEKLDKENPLVLHTDAGRTFSMVRRMKAEKRPDSPEAALIETWISLHRARPDCQCACIRLAAKRFPPNQLTSLMSVAHQPQTSKKAAGDVRPICWRKTKRDELMRILRSCRNF